MCRLQQTPTCCELNNIWKQDWLTSTHFFLPICSHLSPFYPDNPLASPSCLLCLFVCISAPALRDEREEPLAHAADHHHHCDWCHSDCCPGDGCGFAEQTSSPKVQGMLEEIPQVRKPRVGTRCVWSNPSLKTACQIWFVVNMTLACQPVLF